MSEAQKVVRVKILEDVYHLISDETITPEKIYELTSFVEKQMQDIQSANRKLSKLEVAVLAAINIAELAQREQRLLQDSMVRIDEMISKVETS